MTDSRKNHIKETALPGGFLLITERLPYVRSVALGVTFHLGGRDDPAGKEGAAHLVEHMIFQGNAERDAKAISIAAESLGADLNAFTDKEMTCFYGRFPSDEQVEVTRLLGNILARPGFGETELAKEKQVIGEEIRTINEDPDAMATNLMFRAFYAEHPMGSQVIGTQDSVEGIDREWLKRFFDDRYHAGTGVAVAVGDVRPEEIADALGQVLADRGGSVAAPDRIGSEPGAGAVLSQTRSELTQVYVCMCWPAFRYSDERRHALSVLNTAFGGGVSSRLFQRLREDEGLVYSISSFAELFQDSGLLGVYFVTDRRKLEKCLQTLGDEIGRLRTGRLQEEEFERARNMTKSSVLLGLESPTARMMRMARTHHMLGRLVTVDETLAAYNRLELGETNVLVEELFDGHGPTLGAVGPDLATDQQGWDELLTGLAQDGGRMTDDRGKSTKGQGQRARDKGPRTKDRAGRSSVIGQRSAVAGRKGVVLSQRGAGMPASPIRKLVPYADRAKARGIKVYHLNIGQPDIETPAEMLDAYRNLDMKVIAYGPSGGLYDYVEALAGYYRGVGIEAGPENILVTTGGSEAIMFVYDAVTDPGDEVIIPEPFYTNYAGFAAMLNVNVVPLTTHAEQGFALPPKAAFERLITGRTKAIAFSNPGNPTGVVYTRTELEMLRELALEHGLYLVADEVYREFIYDPGVEHVSVLSLEGIDDRAIIVDSISKRYSACGSRVGCIVSRNRDIMAAVLRFGQSRLCPPTVDQVAAKAAISTPPAYFEQVRTEYRARRDLLCKALCEMPGVLCQVPRGAFYTVTKLPVDDAEKFAVFMLEEFDLNGETVMVAPAAGFYATPGMGRDEVRIAYVLNTRDLARAMEILKAGLEAYRGSKGS